MTKIISELLEAPEPLFSINLAQLERASGRPNADIRLTAEIIGKVHQKIRELGLDPKDTNGTELYQALRNLVRLHDQFLASKMGGSDANDVDDMLPRIIQTVARLNVPRTVWSLKHSSAKRLLKANPPKKLMKLLGYRSLDSMLKRESVSALFGTMRFVESSHWFQSFMAKFSKLSASDFETREIAIVSLDNKRWGGIVEDYISINRNNVLEVKELGAILVLPLPVRRLAGVTIVITSMLLHAINEIRSYSAYFKLQQVRPDFGKLIAAMLLDDAGCLAVVAGHKVHWTVAQRHFSQPGLLHPETLEPHVLSDDLSWRRVEETLYRLEPALHFWHKMDYVAVLASDGRAISFNLIDMATNYVNQLSFEKRFNQHFKTALHNELYGRYMLQPSVESQVLDHFNYSVSSADFTAKALRAMSVA